MNYVLVYAKPVNQTALNYVLVVFKNRPEEQAGKINLVGGKIEENEGHLEAAVRELKEEAGLLPVAAPTFMGKITGSWGTVFCVKVPVVLIPPSPRLEETEKIEWVKWSNLAKNPLLMPNLRIVLPMMHSGLTGWIIKDEGPNWNTPSHIVSVEIPK